MGDLWFLGWSVLAILALLVLAAVVFSIYLHVRFLDPLVRIFQERPLFIIPRGKPVANAEDVRFPGTNGLTLHGIYIRTASPRRRGVILFGLEFGSTCEACASYCEHLIASGFDVFSLEPRNQGGSDKVPGYDPLQWVTDYEVEDFRSAIAYLKSRPDVDANGIGLFGISKGGGAGLIAAVDEPSVRCFVTDGAFATHTTMLPYMRKWVSIYSKRRWLQDKLPWWVYSGFGLWALRRVERIRNCRFSHLERFINKLAPRPLLMIHGGDDNYIKTEMAQSLFNQAGDPKELWVVEGAKHNQALHVAGDEYRRRVCEFFQANLSVGVDSLAAPQSVIPPPHWQSDAVPAFHT